MASPKSEKSERVNVVVTPETKAEWEQYYPPHGNEYDGLADLVRTSVRRELGGHHEKPVTQGIGEDALTDVTQSLNGLDTKLSTVAGRMERLENKVNATASPELNLDKVVFDLLPVNPDGGDGVTAHRLAGKYGMDEEKVTHSLQRLEARFGEVVRNEQPSRHGEPAHVSYYRDGGA